MNLWEKSRKIAKSAGPGIITGAADNDPSGILTYLQSGFVYGFKALWLAIFYLPLMYAVQEMAGRIGFVTDKGLVKVIKEHYPRWILYTVGFTSAFVIMVSIGADLLAIGVIAEKFSDITRFFWLPAVSVFILFFTVFLSYPKFAGALKWLTLSLLFYVATAFCVHVDWLSALKATVSPSLIFNKEYVILFAAFLGTTISPYLFFWQADEEVEERDEEKKEKHLKRFLVTKNELKHLKKETFLGMFFSQVITWFVIVVAGQTAVVYGIREITNFDQASLVLQPLLGNFAFIIFGLGIIGAGLLAVPVLAGSVGYVLSEVFNWEEGINKTFREARGFYLVIIIATFIGVAFNFLGLDPVQILIDAAVLFAFITPPLIYLVIHIANNKKIMRDKTNSPLSNFLGWSAFVVSALAVITYVIFVL
ncbi:MAG: divalent metal cation transporter [Minisyncoccia bacterium]